MWTWFLAVTLTISMPNEPLLIGVNKTRRATCSGAQFPATLKCHPLTITPYLHTRVHIWSSFIRFLGSHSAIFFNILAGALSQNSYNLSNNLKAIDTDLKYLFALIGFWLSYQFLFLPAFAFHFIVAFLVLRKLATLKMQLWNKCTKNALRIKNNIWSWFQLIFVT